MTKMRTVALVSAILAVCASTMLHAQLMCYPDTRKPIVYNDVLQPLWYSHEWGSVADLHGSTPGMNGTRAIEVQYATNWGEFILFRSSAFDGEWLWELEDIRALTFRVKGIHNNCEKQIWVHLRNANGQDHVPIPVTDYMVSPESVNAQQCWQDADVPVGIYDPSKWYTVVIPITAFVEGLSIDPDTLVIKDIMFEGGHLGEAGMTELPKVYLDDIWWVEGLEFPLRTIPNDDCQCNLLVDAYSVPISSVFDHHMTATEYSCPDGVVTAYTGEEARASFGDTKDVPGSQNRCGSTLLAGYMQGDGSDFVLNGQYTNGEDNVFLFYDGHTGYDFPVADGTPVYPVADGEVTDVSHHSYGSTIVINHQNGYESHYLHLSDVDVAEGDRNIAAGVTKLGETGDNHLHFTMKLHGVRIDPYGWEGSQEDPYRPVAVGVPLWK